MRSRVAIVAIVLTILLTGKFALADSWLAPIYEYGAPGHIVGVDKKKRKFNFFEKKSPFKLRYSYPCVTGQMPGDKQQINDLRTPEGIYFVEYKIANGLDFREYGGIAYTLNYPNPVDRLRGKTGHGIWIHSKGFELVPTRGCVAIGLDNIAEVGPLLKPGTPVILAEELGEVNSRDNGELVKVRELMSQWSNAWAAKSATLFDFYNPEAYTRATENFDLFKQNKERLFKILSFIKIYNREIHALEGPGYWVTWAEQFYTASNLSTEGIRRLYWQKDKQGQFRIVGMEWTPRNVGMAAAFQKGTLVAEGPATNITDASSEAPVAPRLDMPELAPEASKLPPAPQPIASVAAASVEPLVPARKPDISSPDEIIWGEGKRLTDPQVKPEVKPEAKPEAPTRPTPALHLPSTPAPQERQASPDEIKGEIARLTKNWQLAIQNRDPAIDSFYNTKDYNRLPASSGVPKGRSLASTLQTIKKDFRQPWIVVTSRNPVISSNGPLSRSQTDLLLATPQGIRQGVQSLWWQKDKDGKYRIIASEFKPAELGLEANYLEIVSDDIAAMLEDWRKAWEAGNIEDYMTFYAPNANQQGRIGANNIRKQKESLWGKVKPAHVRLSGLRVALDGSGARADMHQSYSDSSGHGDKGIKTLLLRFDGRNWLIQREEWANLAAQPKLTTGQI